MFFLNALPLCRLIHFIFSLMQFLTSYYLPHYWSFHIWSPLLSVSALWLVCPLQPWSSLPSSSPYVSFVISSSPPNPVVLTMACPSECQVSVYNRILSENHWIRENLHSQQQCLVLNSPLLCHFICTFQLEMPVKDPVMQERPVPQGRRDSENTSWAGSWTVITSRRTPTSCSRGVSRLTSPAWRWKAPP